MRVLLADDDEWVRFSVGELLAYLGHAVVFAEDGVAALERFREARAAGEPFDVLVLDVRMPGLNGPEVARHVRMVDHDVPALICSGFDQSQIDPQLLADPRVRYLAKPFRLEAFEAALEALGVVRGPTPELAR